MDSEEQVSRRALRKALHRDLGALTPGERLFIARRRRGENQYQAGLRLGLSQPAYSRRESDRFPAPAPEGVRPELEELVLVARRRLGYPRPYASNQTGIPVFTLLDIENGRVNTRYKEDLLKQYAEWLRGKLANRG